MIENHGDSTEQAESQGAPYFDGVFLFLGLLLAGVLVFVALLYGFFWLMFDFGS